MGGHNGSSVLCPGAGLEQANSECGASWEGCNTWRAYALAAVYLSYNATRIII